MTINGRDQEGEGLAGALKAYLSSLEDWLESLPTDLDELERLAAEMPARSPFHWPCGFAHSPDTKCVSPIDAPKWIGGLGDRLLLVRSNREEPSGRGGNPAQSLGVSNVVMFKNRGIIRANEKARCATLVIKEALPEQVERGGKTMPKTESNTQLGHYRKSRQSRQSMRLTASY